MNGWQTGVEKSGDWSFVAIPEQPLTLFLPVATAIQVN
jgi:hypothetical protein